MYYIYAIVNLKNKKVYIGQTIRNPLVRFEEHCSAKSGCPALRNAIQKYGRDNFELLVIARTNNRKRLNKLEAELIKKFNTLVPNGYNVKGEGGYSGIIRVQIPLQDELSEEYMELEKLIDKSKTKADLCEMQELCRYRGASNPELCEIRQYSLGMMFSLVDECFPIESIKTILVKAKIRPPGHKEKWTEEFIKYLIVKYFNIRDLVLDISIDYRAVLDDMLSENGWYIEVVS